MTAEADYYEVLGVPRDADGEAIRRAFEAAASEVRPDVSAAPDADERFRQLAEAYSVLSNPGPRMLYDRFGYRGSGNSGIDEALSDAADPITRGDNARVKIVLRAYEAERGTAAIVRYDVDEVCDDCDGRVTQEASDPACPACGGSRTVRRERALKVRVPAGVANGAHLRVGGEGHAGEGGAGDLVIDVRVLPEPHDGRLVRYIALALFLAAVAALVGYLLFG